MVLVSTLLRSDYYNTNSVHLRGLNYHSIDLKHSCDLNYRRFCGHTSSIVLNTVSSLPKLHKNSKRWCNLQPHLRKPWAPLVTVLIMKSSSSPTLTCEAHHRSQEAAQANPVLRAFPFQRIDLSVSQASSHLRGCFRNVHTYNVAKKTSSEPSAKAKKSPHPMMSISERAKRRHKPTRFEGVPILATRSFCLASLMSPQRQFPKRAHADNVARKTSSEPSAKAS